MNVSHKMDSNSNISPKISYGVLESEIVVTELHACDFVIKDFVIKKGCYLGQTLYKINRTDKW